MHTAASLPQRAVLVGHSMGGLVVQQALARYAAHAGVLVAPVPAHPAVGSLLSIARRHPGDAARIMIGRSLPLRPDYLFNQLAAPEAQRLADRCGPESPLAQYQLLLHRPAAPPRDDAPVPVLATPDDALVPIADVRRTAKRYEADIVTFPGPSTVRPSRMWPTARGGWPALAAAAVGLGSWMVLPIVTSVFADAFPMTDTVIMPIVSWSRSRRSSTC